MGVVLKQLVPRFHSPASLRSKASPTGAWLQNSKAKALSLRFTTGANEAIQGPAVLLGALTTGLTPRLLTQLYIVIRSAHPLTLLQIS